MTKEGFGWKGRRKDLLRLAAPKDRLRPRLALARRTRAMASSAAEKLGGGRRVRAVGVLQARLCLALAQRLRQRLDLLA